MSDEPTKIIRRGGAAKPAFDRIRAGNSMPNDDETEIIPRAGGDPDATAKMREFEKTEPVDRRSSAGGAERTVLHRPGKGKAAEGGAAAAESKSDLSDPVVGWLVVIRGPGLGCSVKIGAQHNHVGRERAKVNRIVLDFGDLEISRESQCVLTYDPEERDFVISPGPTASNITRVNGAKLLSPTPLKGREQIRMGQTTLLFIPFCGPDFDWSDLDEAEKPKA